MEFTEKIEKARAEFRTGRTRDVIWRQNQLRALCVMIEDNRKRIKTVLQNDLNKVDFEAEIEIMSVLSEAAEGNRLHFNLEVMSSNRVLSNR